MVHSQIEHPLLLETALRQAAAFFRRYLTAFLSAMGFGLLAYGFAKEGRRGGGLRRHPAHSAGCRRAYPALRKPPFH